MSVPATKTLAFTTQYKGRSNVLKTNVGILAHPSNDNNPGRDWVSLWDTGATCSVITHDVVEKLDLKPVSMSVVSTPQGSYNAYVYYIDLFLPNGVRFPKLQVLEGQPSGCDILIGMDVIGKGDFAVSSHNDQTTFSYRSPSISVIDFVENSYEIPVVHRATPDGPAKNSKCPCGSGKKYKQCCGKGLF